MWCTFSAKDGATNRREIVETYRAIHPQEDAGGGKRANTFCVKGKPVYTGVLVLRLGGSLVPRELGPFEYNLLGEAKSAYQSKERTPQPQ